MQIIRLNVDDNKCLVDFGIHFEIDNEHGSSTILIGENGTGKSSMLQTVLEIMMSFDSDSIAKRINYRYSIEYFYKGSTILIQQSEKRYRISIDGEQFCAGSLNTVKARLAAENKSIFPERIHYFYSGLNDHALSGMRRVGINYANVCRKDLARYWNALYLANHEYEGVFPKRKYNYCTEALVPAYAVALLCGNDSFGKAYLLEQCHISQVESFSTIISVEKLRNRLQNDIVEVGVEGVLDLIGFIDDRFTELFRRGFVYRNDEQFTFDMRDISQVEADTVSFFNFFEKLSTIFDAEFGVTLKVGNSSVNCTNLSEGQRQLIKILGMLCVCKDEDTLVLMDEPDAHMNPKWKYELKQTIDNCLSASVNTQAIIATHDPLVINGVPKEYIRVFAHNKSLVNHNSFYFTKVIVPTEDTEGLGIDGLLQSEYYGLATVLDTETRKKMDTKNDLLVKKVEGTISEPEKHELKTLSEELENMSFARNIPTDQYYDEFVAAMHKIYRERPQVQLTAEDIAERNAKAEEILKGLLER